MASPANETPGSFATAYQHWFGPATFLRCPYQPDGKDTDIGLVGVPHCGGNPIEHMQYYIMICPIAPQPKGALPL